MTPNKIEALAKMITDPLIDALRKDFAKIDVTAFKPMDDMEITIREMNDEQRKTIMQLQEINADLLAACEGALIVIQDCVRRLGQNMRYFQGKRISGVSCGTPDTRIS